MTTCWWAVIPQYEFYSHLPSSFILLFLHTHLFVQRSWGILFANPNSPILSHLLFSCVLSLNSILPSYPFCSPPPPVPPYILMLYLHSSILIHSPVFSSHPHLNLASVPWLQEEITVNPSSRSSHRTDLGMRQQRGSGIARMGKEPSKGGRRKDAN